MTECAFPAFINKFQIRILYGDKEATLVLNFRPEDNIIEGLNALMKTDQAVMVAIVPIDKTKENYNAVQEGGSRKSKGKTKRGEV